VEEKIMSKRKRTSYTAEFKARVCIEAIKATKTNLGSDRPLFIV